MKQKFNTGVAIKYGVYSAVIVSIMVDFLSFSCKL